MEKALNRKIVLQNGREFYGGGFGAKRDALCEIVFNTSMVGYQEILSDPSYTGQMVVMTYPLIGNYGVTDEDFETRVPSMGGMIVREVNDSPSNFRSTKSIAEVLEENNIPGISEVDTREITRIIRSEGSQKVLLTDAETPHSEAMKRIQDTVLPRNQVAQVSCKKVWYARTSHPKFNVVAVDCGIKMNIVRKLIEKGCNVTVVPYNTGVKEIMNLKPDGLFLSNGPGDPEDVPEVIGTVKALQGRLPIFGICLGHQMIALANGAKTYKMKFGHRGGNHPVKNLLTGKIEITSQNHSFAVDADSVKGTKLEMTHVNLLDSTAEGLRSIPERIFSVQYHPESAPGPQDSAYLFDTFIGLMNGENHA
jgi:carbamoyl-phosphate synthase small subunit